MKTIHESRTTCILSVTHEGHESRACSRALACLLDRSLPLSLSRACILPLSFSHYLSHSLMLSLSCLPSPPAIAFSFMLSCSLCFSHVHIHTHGHTHLHRHFCKLDETCQYVTYICVCTRIVIYIYMYFVLFCNARDVLINACGLYQYIYVYLHLNIYVVLTCAQAHT